MREWKVKNKESDGRKEGETGDREGGRERETSEWRKSVTLYCSKWKRQIEEILEGKEAGRMERWKGVSGMIEIRKKEL